jgi:hypothetical protein
LWVRLLPLEFCAQQPAMDGKAPSEALAALTKNANRIEPAAG